MLIYHVKRFGSKIESFGTRYDESVAEFKKLSHDMNCKVFFHVIIYHRFPLLNERISPTESLQISLYK